MSENDATKHSISCASCGQEIDADGKFCKHCGGAQSDVRQQAVSGEPLDRTRPQGRRWIRPILGAVFGVVAVVLLYLSPYLSVYQFKRASEANDIDAVKERVDFSALRGSLVADLEDALSKKQSLEAKKQSLEAKKPNDPFGEVGALIGGGLAHGIIRSVADTVVTPKNLARLVRGEGLDLSSLMNGFGEEATKPSAKPEAPKHPEMSMGYETLNRFGVRFDISSEDLGAERGTDTVTLLFTRAGLGWTLTGMRVAKGHAGTIGPNPPMAAVAASPNQSTSLPPKGELRSLSYVGRMPDLDFFSLPEIRGALTAYLSADSLEDFTPSGWRHVDASNVTLRGRTLGVDWEPTISRGLSGAMLVLDIDTRRTVVAYQNDEPIIKFYGDYQSVSPSSLPQGMSDWVGARTSDTEEAEHKPPKLIFVTKDGSDLVERLSVAGIKEPSTVENFLELLKSSVANEQKMVVARLISYPLFVRLNGQNQKMDTLEGFTANYDRIINKTVKKAIADASLSDLSASSNGIMIGRGQLHFTAFDGGRLLVTGVYSDEIESPR